MEISDKRTDEVRVFPLQANLVGANGCELNGTTDYRIEDQEYLTGNVYINYGDQFEHYHFAQLEGNKAE